MEIISAIELLIKELPNIKWVGKNILSYLISELKGAESLPETHTYKFDTTELKQLNLAKEKLINGFKDHDIDYNLIDYGLFNSALYNSAIYTKNTLWGKLKPVHKIELNQVNFIRLIGATKNDIVLETDKRIALFNPDSYTLRYLTPLTKLAGRGFSILWSKNNKKATIIENNLMSEYTANSNVLLMDFENMEIIKKEATEEETKKIIDPLPQSGILFQKNEIVLNWDGLLIKKE